MYEPLPKEGTSLDSAIREMDVVAGEHPEKKLLFQDLKCDLETISTDLAADILTPEAACGKLFNLYCHFQMEIQDTEAAYIFRVVGDDLGRQLGVDDDLLWEMYQEALDGHS